MTPNDVKLLKRLRDMICGTSISPCTPYVDALDRAIAFAEKMKNRLGDIEIRLMNPDDTLDYKQSNELSERPIQLSAPDCQYWIIKRVD